MVAADVCGASACWPATRSDVFFRGRGFLSVHGYIQQGKCFCDTDWNGTRCNVPVCPQVGLKAIVVVGEHTLRWHQFNFCVLCCRVAFMVLAPRQECALVTAGTVARTALAAAREFSLSLW